MERERIEAVMEKRRSGEGGGEGRGEGEREREGGGRRGGGRTVNLSCD